MTGNAAAVAALNVVHVASVRVNAQAVILDQTRLQDDVPSAIKVLHVLYTTTTTTLVQAEKSPYGTESNNKRESTATHIS